MDPERAVQEAEAASVRAFVARVERRAEGNWSATAMIMRDELARLRETVSEAAPDPDAYARGFAAGCEAAAEAANAALRDVARTWPVPVAAYSEVAAAIRALQAPQPAAPGARKETTG